jgi:hypothetical protein
VAFQGTFNLDVLLAALRLLLADREDDANALEWLWRWYS